MELTKEEMEVFQNNYGEKDIPSYIEEGLMQSYFQNDETVKATYAYIKRALLELAVKRGIEINENEQFDIDSLLAERISVPENFKTFKPLYLKNIEKLNRYIDAEAENMTLEEVGSLVSNFSGWGGIADSFRDFMTGYIPRLISNIPEWSRNPEENLESDAEFFSSNAEQGLDSTDEEWEDFAVWDDADFDGFEVEEDFGTSTTYTPGEKIEITNDELVELIKFVNTYPQISECRNNGIEFVNRLVDIKNTKKLNEFYSDKSFTEAFKSIMSHDKDKHIYHFHGTQCLADAKTIMEEGLGMMQNDLSSTSYSEFTMDEVILYERGITNEVGRDAIVIIDEPIQEDGKKSEIVESIPDDKQIHFSPSGLQGLDGRPEYIVDSRYIVGYVDKKNKAVVYNPRYYDYDRIKLGADKSGEHKLTAEELIQSYKEAEISNGDIQGAYKMIEKTKIEQEQTQIQESR